jgi:hypothetical protein
MPTQSQFVNGVKRQIFNGKYITEPFKQFLLKSLDLGPNTYVGARIGTPSQNGAIFEMANNKVLKVIVDIGYPPTDFRADFKAEVKVGKIPGIEKVGTRIYQAMYSTQIHDHYIVGAYVMDNLLTDQNKRNGNKLMSLDEYWHTYYRSRSCPVASEHDRKMFTYLMYDFYKITKGYHADLHGGNIQAIVRPDGVLKQLKVIDYGSHTGLKRNISSLKCLDHILDVIQEEFNRIPCNNSTCYWGNNAGPHKYPVNRTRSQRIIGNARILRRTNAQPLFNKKLASVNNLNRLRTMNRVRSVIKYVTGGYR